jgi:hypothetical protein
MSVLLHILTQRGYKSHVLGWFAGHPAEPINGISVSDLYPYAVAPLDTEWPLPPGAVHPERLRETFASLDSARRPDRSREGQEARGIRQDSC